MNGGAGGRSSSLDSARIESTLIDLDDGLLLKILDILHGAPDIVRLGAVNKRLHRLHFLVSRIDVKGSHFTQAHLDSLLKGVARNARGILQQLSALVMPSHLPGRLLIPAHDAFFTDLTSCTNLVSLALSLGGPGAPTFSGVRLQQVLAACTKLRSFNITGRFCRWDSLKLASESLEELQLESTWDLDYPTYVTLSLETPSLATLRIAMNIGKLNLLSHALKVMNVGGIEGSVTVATPLTSLEILFTTKFWSVGALEQVLRSISTRCLDTLVVSDEVVSVADLPAVLSSLRHLKQLIVELERQEVPELAMDAPVHRVSGLEVEEIVVVATPFSPGRIENFHFECLCRSVMVLQRSFHSVRKIAVRGFWFFGYHGIISEDPYNLAMRRCWEALKQEFPLLITDHLHADTLHTRCGRWR